MAKKKHYTSIELLSTKKSTFLIDNFHGGKKHFFFNDLPPPENRLIINFGKRLVEVTYIKVRTKSGIGQ